MNTDDIQAVRDVLKKFQDGYDRRDTTLLDDFRRLFVQDDVLEVIGTGAVEPGDDEWCLGVDAACSLVQNDWEAWGDLALDVADARIHSHGDVAWLATTGTVKMEMEQEETYRDYMDYIQSVASDEESDPRQRMIEILRGATNTLFEAERGRNYLWPIRFSAVMLRQDGEWRFHQIQFSFATTRFPDVRNV